MRHGGQVIVFSRTPRFGHGKRRLAAQEGECRVWQFQRQQWRRLQQMTQGYGGWVAVPSLRSPVRPRFARSVWQGRGDLGARMIAALRHVLGRVGRGVPLLLVGSDIPEFGPQHVRHAFRVLRWADVVYGPAEDGGFWAIGWSGRRPVEQLGQLFDGVGWSHSRTLAEALSQQSALQRRERVGLLACLADVDERLPAENRFSLFRPL